MTTHDFLLAGLTNAVFATVLAVAGWLLTRLWPNPHVASVVWLAVLLKLVTPPVVALPVKVDAVSEARLLQEAGLLEPLPLSLGRGVRGEGSASEFPSSLQSSAALPAETHAAIERTSQPLTPGPSPQGEGGRSASQFAENAAEEVSEREVVSSDADAAPTPDPASVPFSLGRGVRGEGSSAASPRALQPSVVSEFEAQAAVELTSVPLGSGPSPQGKERRSASGSPAFESRLLREAGILGRHIPRLAPSLLLAVWLVGTLLLGFVTIFSAVRFHRMLKQATAVDHEMQRTAVCVASRLGLKRCPAVRSVAASVGPMVWAGSLSPLVIVPRPLWDSLGEDERETLLAHELAHVVRRDHVVRRFEAVVLALYWWLPTAWLAVRRREAAAETCCDALVLSHYPDRPQAYAEALLTAVTVLSTSRTPALASGLGRKHELKERLTMIVHDRVPNRPGRAVRWSVLLVAGVALALSARLVQAEPEEKPEPTPAVELVPTIAPAAAAPATTAEEPAAPAVAPSAEKRPETAPAYEQPAAAAPAGHAEPAAAKPAITADEILFFHADWAANAQHMKRDLEKLRKLGYPIRLVDVTDRPDLMRPNNIESVPTIVFFKNGKEVDRFVGMATDEKLRELADKLPVTNADQGDPLSRDKPAGITIEGAVAAPADAAAPAGRPAAAKPSATSDEILFFCANWAEPCQKMKPIVEKLRRVGLPFRIVDVDRERELAAGFEIEAIPAFLAVKDGKEVDRRVGSQSEQSLREFAFRTVGDDRAKSLSPDTRAKMIDGLIAVLEDKKQPEDVKTQAMLSLVRLSESTADAERVRDVLLKITESSTDSRAKLIAADKLSLLGYSRNNELLWSLWEETEDQEARKPLIDRLVANKFVPPTTDALQALARSAVLRLQASGIDILEKSENSPLANTGEFALLRRTLTSEHGIRQLIEAIEATKEQSGLGGGGLPSGRRMTGGKNEETILLLHVLAMATPATDEIAAALVEALSHKDAGVREAAAKALGNTEPAAGRGGSRGPMGGSRSGMRSPMGMRARGSDSFAARYEAASNPLQPADAANPFGFVQTPPEQPQVSPAVRKELIKSLTAAGTDEKATPQSRSASLRTLAKLTKGTDEADATAKIVQKALERAKDEEERRVLTSLLLNLGHPRASSTLWAMLPEPDYAVEFERRQFDMLSELNAVGAVPQTPQDTVKLGFAIAVLKRDQEKNHGEFTSSREEDFAYSPLEAATKILERMQTSGEGVRRIVEAYALADKPAPETPGSEAFGPKEHGYTHDTPVRQVLLAAIVFVRPTSDEIATALAEALSNEDGAVRAAAAAALGNLNGSK